ncbi:ssDNA endonuclease and repair protein rad10 [Blastocladiella emersonii ATCC 22665]|nr:ssDNA endonuclease and repair protein rad10 [Blastocladiella emersonii ATCC 22665]
MPPARKAKGKAQSATAAAAVPPPPTFPAVQAHPKTPGAVLVHVRVKPAAKESRVVAAAEGAAHVELQIAAPAREGEANAEVVAFVGRVLGARKSDVALVRGHKSREKTVEVAGVSPDEAVAALKSSLAASGNAGGSAPPPRRRFVVPSAASVLDAPRGAPRADAPPPPPMQPAFQPPPPQPQPPAQQQPVAGGPAGAGPGFQPRPAWQQRAIAGANGAPSAFYPGAEPAGPAGGNGPPNARAEFVRKRKLLQSEDLFKLPELPTGAPPAPAPGSARATAASSNAILVNGRQRKNPVVSLIHSVPLEFGDTPADFVLGATAGALFLSIQYHRLHPEYLVQRLRGMSGSFDLRILLVLVDVADYQSSVRELTRTCIDSNLTLLLAWSNEECARYLEIYKSIEFKPPEVLMGRQETDYLSRLTEALTQVKGVNRTDVVTLASQFGSFAAIVKASVTDLANCPGIGEKKATRIYEAFRMPFVAAGDAVILDE